MDLEAFIRWSLDASRTVAERFTVELLTEHALMFHSSRRTPNDGSQYQKYSARRREQELNPAYRPEYSEDDLRCASEYLATIRDWSPNAARAVESFAPLQFLPTLESITARTCAVVDFSPLAKLPSLRMLAIGSPGHDFGKLDCEDFSSLSGCKQLRELHLAFDARWPDLRGIAELDQLETLILGGNLLAMPHGTTFPNVRRASLYCTPLAARNLHDLPQLPACEFLTLRGAERLDGIEKMPGLRNLRLEGPFHSFAPLVPLNELTWMTVDCPGHRDATRQPRDVSPLARLPKLAFFQIGPSLSFFDMPRDYSPLAEAPALRELVVRQCPPVQMEVAALNIALQPWDDLFLAREPRTLEPLRMIVGPNGAYPHRSGVHRGEDEPELFDSGLRECEGRWVKQFVSGRISERIGTSDWGKLDANGENRGFGFYIESFDVVEKLPEILEAARSAMAELRYEYQATFMISLRVPPPVPTPEQKKFNDRLQNEQDDWEFEQMQKDRQEYVDRLHQMELKQQQGAEINPEEFSPSERAEFPEPKSSINQDDDDDDGDGEIAVDHDPDPSDFLSEDEHPLADSYRLLGHLTLNEAWFLTHHRGLAVHLMMREPDVEIPDETKPLN